MRVLLLVLVVILFFVSIGLDLAEPAPKDFSHLKLLDCTGPNGADPKTVRATQQAWANFLGEKSHEKTMALDKEGKVLIDMVLVPPGFYYRGSPEGKGRIDEHPQKVILISKPMWVGKYEVTQTQFKGVLGGKNPLHFRDDTDKVNYPEDTVEHDEAVAFCQAATGGKFQLLTEAQWEYAYRAGTRTAWYSGDEEKSVEKIAALGFGGPSAVGSKAANAFGLHDMAGNVWEWCSDRFETDSYREASVLNPIGPKNGIGWALRGGGWSSSYDDCRAAFRNVKLNIGVFVEWGFRVCVILD